NPRCGGMCSICFRNLGKAQDKPDKDAVASSSRGSKSGDPVAEGVDLSPATQRRPEAVPEAVPSAGQIAQPPNQHEGGHAAGGEPDGPADASGVASACGECSHPRKRRCTADNCKKRVGMMGFKCRCGGVFCEGHRYPEAHACEFDHKASERQKIASENPVVRGDKLDKI
ncbi:unnamed protein product, partial [Ostreobium quekettii]